MIPIIVVVIFIIIMVFVVRHIKAIESERTEAIRKYARKKKYNFNHQIDAEHCLQNENFQLFDQGHSKSKKNIISFDHEGISIEIFDYKYSTGHGKQRRTHQQTLSILSQENQHFPRFFLSPENFFHRIATSLGYQDIDFDSNEGFSKKYLLRGKDEDSIRKFFRSSLLHYLEEEQVFHIESNKNSMIIYHADKLVKVENINEFIDQSKSVYKKFLLAADLVR